MVLSADAEACSNSCILHLKVGASSYITTDIITFAVCCAAEMSMI
jgi:hypothetical protein